MARPISAFYRIMFTTIDPVLTISGIASNLFAQETILRGYSPYYTFPPAAETTYLLYANAGFFTALLVLQIFLLRPDPTNIGLWRVVQIATALVDVFMLAGYAKVFSAEQRADPKAWRVEDWVNVVITGGVLLVRAAFVLGIGTRAKTGLKKG